MTQIADNLLRFAKNKFGLNQNAIKTIYTGALLPIISYGVSVWAPAIDRKFVITPLTRIQRKFALRIAKAYRTVSTDATNILCDLMPIDLYLKGRSVEYYMKNKVTNRLNDSYFQNTNIEITDIQRPLDVRQLKPKPLRYKLHLNCDNISVNNSNEYNIFY